MSEKDDNFEPADLPEDEDEKQEQAKKGRAAKAFTDIASANNLKMDSTQYIGYSLAKVVSIASTATDFADFQAKLAPYTTMADDFIAAVEAVEAPV